MFDETVRSVCNIPSTVH